MFDLPTRYSYCKQKLNTKQSFKNTENVIIDKIKNVLISRFLN